LSTDFSSAAGFMHHETRSLQANRQVSKSGEYPYRYSSNGVYYARIKTSGKEIRQSLGAPVRQKATRELRHSKMSS
jgi:hypothetical protein